jgi:carbamoyl-phosphate synthase large subunit
MNNILITSAGRRVSLIKFFKIELKKIFVDAKIFTTDFKPELSSACNVSDGFFSICRVTDTNYIQSLLEICIENKIKILIPTIDTELLVLSKNIQLFKNNNIEVVISDFETIKIFRNKRLTHEFFEKFNLKCAKEFDKTNYEFPIYIKPIDGSRSVDNYTIFKDEQLTDYHLENEKLMFLEYLDHSKHTEFTIDMYYDKNSKLKCLVPRQRLEIRDGEVNKAITKLENFNDEIWKKLEFVAGFRGCITLQIFVNNNTNAIYGIEINPRFGGGFPLSYLAGANFVKWIIQEYLLNQPIEIFQDWEKNLMMLRYDETVLVRNFKP